MSANLTRFYYDISEDMRTSYFQGKCFDDVETTEADSFEEQLQEREIEYIRIDL